MLWHLGCTLNSVTKNKELQILSRRIWNHLSLYQFKTFLETVHYIRIKPMTYGCMWDGSADYWQRVSGNLWCRSPVPNIIYLSVPSVAGICSKLCARTYGQPCLSHQVGFILCVCMLSYLSSAVYFLYTIKPWFLCFCGDHLKIV